MSARGDDLRWLLRHARPARARLALAGLAGATATASSVALLAVSAWLISTAALRPPILTLTVAIVAVRALGLARGVLRYGERLVSHDAALRVQTRLRVDVFRELERVAPAALGSPRAGDVLRRVAADVDALQDLLLRVLLPAAGTALVALAAIGLLTWLTPPAGLAVLAAFLGATVVAVLTARSAAAAADAHASTAAELAVEVVDVLRGSGELLAFGADRAALDRLAGTDRRLASAQRRAATAAGTSAGLTTLLGGAAVIACLVAGAAAVRSGGLAGPNLAVVVLTPLALGEALVASATAAQLVPGIAAAARRLRLLAATPTPVATPVAAHTVPAGPPRVTASRLTLRWPTTATTGVPATAPDAVRDLDLDLAPGTVVAVAGPSGSGKSTVVAALLRFLEPVAGGLRVGGGNGVDVRRADPDDVRSRFAWCGPDAHLFDASLRANLLVARPGASDGALLAAVRAARLDGWLAAQPAGLDTAVGAHGEQLSGGERQRLALARAVLADRPVLVLDEPTAHLDGPTAAALTADLVAAASDRTTLVVTHSPDQLAAADAVVRLPAPDASPPEPARREAAA